MNETGKVVAVDAGALWVEARRESSCGSCAAQKGCGQSLLSRLYPERNNYLRLPLSPVDEAKGLAFQPGDVVEFSVSEGRVLQGSVLIYLVPIMALLGGAVLGREFFAHELSALLCAVLAMAAAYLWLSKRLSRESVKAQFEPELVGPVIAQHSHASVRLIPAPVSDRR